MPAVSCQSSILSSMSWTAAVMPATDAGSDMTVSTGWPLSSKSPGTRSPTAIRTVDNASLSRSFRVCRANETICSFNARTSPDRNRRPPSPAGPAEDLGVDGTAGRPCRSPEPHFDGPVIRPQGSQGFFVLPDVDGGHGLHGLDQRLKIPGAPDGPFQAFEGLHLGRCLLTRPPGPCGQRLQWLPNPLWSVLHSVQCAGTGQATAR
jgi:hypothetical protein